ncbi:MAG: hypothetical protein U0229_20610 [Anaeromyxobacter sp.]
MKRRIAATLAALLLPALAAADGWRCEARGGPAWREVATEHFRVATDAPPAEARALARELERLQLALRSALFRTPPPVPGRVPVVAFASAADYRAFGPGCAAAFEAVVDGRATLVLSMDSGEAARIAAANALARHVIGRVFVRQPRWFAEGMAAYLETLGDGDLQVGRVPANRLAAVTPWPGGLGAVLRARGPLAGAREQGLAWALVHFLAHRRAQELGRLEQRLARGADPDAAWREAFPAWSPDDPAAMAALDAEVGAYLAKGRLAAGPMSVPSAEPEVEERPLPAAAVHALRLSLPRRDPDREDVAAAWRAELDEALAEDPANPVALGVLAERSPAEGRTLAARATKGHPGDPRAWLLAADHAADPATREQALRRAVELAPEHPGALSELARFLAITGRAADALPVSRKAAAISPTSAPVLDTHASVLHAAGKCRQALDVQRRALDLLPDGLDTATRRPYEARLAKLEAECGGPAAPAGRAP